MYVVQYHYLVDVRVWTRWTTISSDDGQVWMGRFTSTLLDVESHSILCRLNNVLKVELKINPP
jgi:hypothetical protein